jgi:hypothetical protein
MIGDLFFSDFEIHLIKSDLKELTESNESCEIIFTYYSNIESNHAIDNVYGYSKSERKNIEFKSRGIQRLLSEGDPEVVNLRILQSGDCIFYLRDNLNLSKPNGVDSVLEDSLIIIDSIGRKWIPISRNLKDETGQQFNLDINGHHYATVIPCSLKRAEK